MSSQVSNYMASPSSFVDYVAQRNPQQPEFIQSVEEVVESIWAFLQDNPKYIKAKILERMVEAERIIQFRVPWVDDAGEFHINRGFRVQMNSAIGPYKGGLRFDPTVNQSILKFLAFEQTFKNALTTLPMGGGKGGSDFNPKGKSNHEVMRFCQSFMTELHRHIGRRLDVPAGDIGVGAREIGYLFGQYKRIQNEFTGVLTGKDFGFGGSRIRPEATGYGCVYFMEEMLKTKGETLAGKVCVVSGSGNVAQYTAEKLIQKGAKVVTMSDSSGCIYDKDGINADKLAWIMELKNERRGRIHEYAAAFEGVEYVDKGQPWSIKCDLAFPCATQNELNGEEAQQLLKNGCMAVAEGANMPATPAAIDAFHEAKILFAPGKAANAGGVSTSGLEMAQNALHYQWGREEVENRLHTIMKDIHATCVKYGTDSDGYVNYVKGANVGGFAKVAEAMYMQGLV